MDSSFSASSRRSYDIPKPETGLAEWTSKIKALQREVDADEEAEQKRLEEEISAARQARLRRSRGAGAGSRADSIDMSSTREKMQEFGRVDDNSSIDIPKSVTERANDQETALRKLMGRNEVYNPDKTLFSTPSRASTEQSEPKSLASFIGGRANGPRLNRHAPQPDAHDPTQYIQPDLSAPHPVFGKGGIAMPGMAINKAIKATTSTAGSELSERYQPSSAKNTPLKTLAPLIASQRPTVTPESNTRESFDLRRRSFTSKDVTPAPKDIVKVETSNEISPRMLNESSQPITSQSPYAASKVNSFVHVLDTAHPSITPAASKPLPSYVGTMYTSKPTSASNTPQKAEPVASGARTPLRRLMETNNVYNPDQRDIPRKTVAERAQTVSLAGFIGGSGAGPRLNKHAPQPDAHDPTQFIQPDTSAPHPIFGRGGVAMPGLASRKVADPSPTNDSVERYRPSPSAKAVWPPVQTPYTEKPQDERLVSPQKTGSRERTLSTPGSRSNLIANFSQSSDNWSATNMTFNVGRRSPTKAPAFATPGRDRTISTPSNNHSFAATISTPALARPIQPIPKATSISPLISATVPSPAFQKPTPSKDLTPSISRLQGRGFVQNMVKVSSQLDIPASPTPSAADRSRPASAAGRKSSVLDRWQPHVQSPSPTKSSAPPLGNAMRRSATQEPTSYSKNSPSPVPVANFGSSHSLKSVASLPSLTKSASAPPTQPLSEEPSAIAEPYQRSRTPGLGSATTMVLIKPSKSATDLTQLTQVDELGVKRDSVTTTTSKKPLIHPTKERARKPKKSVHSLHYVDSNSTKLDAMNSSPILSSTTLRSETESLVHIEQSLSLPLPQNLYSDKVSPPASTDTIYEAPSWTGSLSVASKSKHSDSSAENLNQRPTKLSPTFTATIRKSKSAPVSPINPSFGKLSRIPSTGSRPTVMEVAQTLIEQTEETPISSIDGDGTPAPTESPDRTAKSRHGASQTQAEKRKSTHEKYSSFVLPSLKEEATPTPTPVGTLNISGSRLTSFAETISEEDNIVTDELPRDIPESTDVTKSDVVQVSETDQEPFPYINVGELLNSPFGPPSSVADAQTISVELFLLIGTTAAPIKGPINAFYESEILTIVHRTKSKSSGLVSTSVWCWLGRRSILGDREERKLQDLAKRYGTSAKIVYQLAEPAELIQTLGGTLTIRQGSRTHWSPENTTMHLVRSLKGAIFIDELDLNVKNLCSAFSYCLTILGSIYLWHGRGSTTEERTAARKYAESLSNDKSPPIELLEGESDDDEMFWMMLGDEDFARADYWKWRKTFSGVPDPMIWRVEPDNATHQAIFPVEFISLDKHLQVSVYIINCVWELFVLVGKEARSSKRTIRLALDTATKISQEVSSSRPYPPTVHVLVLPSQIPLDLRLGIRDFDEAWLNNGEIPDHMSLLSYPDAASHFSSRYVHGGKLL